MANVPTPFLTRFSAGWLSVRTYWLSWVLTATFAAMGWGVIWNAENLRRQPERKHSALVSWGPPKPRFLAGVSAVTQNSVPPEAARSLQVFVPLGEWRTTMQLDSLPRLLEADIFTTVTADDLAWLAQQPRLSNLTLTTTNGLSGEALSQLSRSSSLRTLTLRQAEAYRSDEPITWPPNLEVLELETPYPLSVMRLRELSRLPRLHTLMMQLDPAAGPSQLPDDVAAALASWPSLRRLYLRETPAAPQLVRNVGRQLSRVAVRPATYDDPRLFLNGAAATIAGLWMLVVTLLLSAQFVIPQSVLLPGYRRPHVAVAATVLGIGLLVTWALLRWLGLDGLTAAGVMGGVAGCIGGFIAGFRRLEPGMPGFTQPFLAFPIFVFTVAAMMTLRVLSPIEVDWFLRGELPFWSAGLIVIGVIMMVDTTRWLTGLHRSVEAAGRGGCPLGFLDMDGWKHWSLAANRQRNPPRLQARLTGSGRRLDRATAQPQRSPADRRRLWDAGAEIPPLRAGLQTVAISLVAVGGVVLWGVYSGERTRFELYFMAPALAYAAAMMVYVPAIVLYQRRQQFAMELLRPVSRADWIRDWFLMTARDLSPAALFLSTAAVIGVWQQPTLAPANWLPLTLIFVAGCLAVWAGELWLITYHWAAAFVLVALLVFSGLMFGLAFSASRLHIEAWASSLSGLWTIALVVALLAAGLCLGAYRRWCAWELGAA